MFVGSILHPEMRDSFGIVQLPGKPGEKPGEKWKHSKASMRKLEAQRQWDSLFSFFVSLGVVMGEGTHMEQHYGLSMDMMSL